MRYIEKHTPNGNIDSHSHYDWREASNLYQQLVTGQLQVRDHKLKEMIGRWQTAVEGDRFMGCNAQTMVDRIQNGYEFDTTIDPECLPSVAFDKPRARYTDDPEGEFNYDLFASGEPECFLNKPKRHSVGGLRLKVHYDFNAGVTSKAIADYAQWMGTVIQSLQSKGYDLEVDVAFRARGTYQGQAECEQTLRLSRFGERVMPYDWSSLFSPGGFRHFNFMMILWVGEVEPSVENTHGMGSAQGQKWDILWEPKERVIEVTCDSNSNDFPAKHMTERFESWKE